MAEAKVMGFGGGFAKGFAEGMAKNLDQWAKEEGDAAAVAAARYEENRKSFFEKNKEDEEKVAAAEAMIEQLYPKANAVDKRARTTDAVELLRAGYTIDKTLSLMEDRVYKDTIEQEKKAETEVKPEATESKDINAQTDELISDVNKALNEVDSTTDNENKRFDGTVIDSGKDKSGDTGFEKEVKDESGDTEFKQEVKDESNDLGFLGNMRKRQSDRRASRISKRVDELTGVTAEERDKMAKGFLPTDYVRIDGEGRAEFNLKVDKEDELSGWDYYRLALQDNENFQQLDNLGKAQWLVQAEGEYKAIEGGKNYSKGTYLAELNREELLEQKILEAPENYDEQTVSNNRFMLDIILPMRKANLDILGEDSDGSGSSANNQKNLVNYELRINTGTEDDPKFIRRTGKLSSIHVTEEFITAYPEYEDKIGSKVNVYIMPNTSYGANGNSRYIPQDSSIINNSEMDTQSKERRDLGTTLQSKDIYKTVVDGKAGVGTALRSAYEIDQMVYKQPDVLLAGGSMETFFSELSTDINSVLNLVTGNHGANTRISETEALKDLDSYYTKAFGGIGQLSETAKAHRLFTMRMIKFAYASARIDGNYGQGLSDKDLKLTFDSITGAKDYATFSKNLKMIVGQSVNEVNESVRLLANDGVSVEYVELGGSLPTGTVEQESIDGNWNDAYEWSQTSVDDWIKQNPLNSSGEKIDIPKGTSILIDNPGVALDQTMVDIIKQSSPNVKINPDDIGKFNSFRILTDGTVQGYNK